MAKNSSRPTDTAQGTSKTDEAASPGGPPTKGGIDLNPNNLPLKNIGKGENILDGVDEAMLEQMNINGLTPVIWSVTPIESLSELLPVAPEFSIDKTIGF